MIMEKVKRKPMERNKFIKSTVELLTVNVEVPGAPEIDNDGIRQKCAQNEAGVRKCVRAHVSIVDVARTITIVTVSFASKTLVLCVLTHVCVSTTTRKNGTSVDLVKNSAFTLYSPALAETAY